MRDLDAVRRNEIRAALREAAKFMKTVVVAAQLTWVTIALAIHVSMVIATGFGAAWVLVAVALWHLRNAGLLKEDARKTWRLFREMVAEAWEQRSIRFLWVPEDEKEEESVPLSDVKVIWLEYHPDSDSYGWAKHGDHKKVVMVRRFSGVDVGVWFVVDGGTPLVPWFQNLMEAEYERARDLQVAAGKEGG